LWQVALGLHAIEFDQTSAILEFYFWFRFRPYHTISPQSTCHSAPVCEILSKLDHPRQKKMTLCRFSRWRISAILDFRGPCMTSCRSSIETMALNCLVFEKIAFLYFGDRQTNKQTDRQTNRWTGPLHESTLAVASGGLTSVSETIRKPPSVKTQNAFKKNKKICRKRF